ncbi:MAG: polysaccharide deacetylase family protein [Treponema sp.]|nr:polysaccharide deacetylase family protein [Treponema sp.]
MYPDGKMKALTLSYDDGVEQDKHLIEILNRYNIKGTFNINSGIQSAAGSFQKGDVLVRRMNVRGLPELYKDHEVAVHSLTHPHLENLDRETVINELETDKLNIERIFKTNVYGMAYPFGTFNETVISAVRECSLCYARGVQSTYSFDIPRNLLAYQPTMHHKDPKLMETAETFLALKTAIPQVFYVWGHSYEFEADKNWHIMEDFCKLVSGRDDIYYAVNAQALLG